MKVLVVEDEKFMRHIIRQSLEKEHFIVEEAATYAAAIEKIDIYEYDCILLDIMLPDGNGLQILQWLKARQRKESVLIISAKDAIDDKVAGLELGADDYLAKPFHLAELNARVKSVIRRNRPENHKQNIELGNVSLDPDARTVAINNAPLALNRKEFDTLYYMMINPERLISKTNLAEAVWGDNIDQADSLDFIYSQIKNLRKKLKDADATIEISAVYGFGYKLTTGQ